MTSVTDPTAHGAVVIAHPDPFDDGRPVEPDSADPSDSPDPIGAAPPRRLARARRNWHLIRSMMALHPRHFVIAFFGAALFALGTVASSFAIQWAIDHVVIPRFDDGDVGVGTVATGIGLIVGIGVVRAFGVVIRRSFASMGMWRVAQTYTNQVLDRLIRQPVAWHRRHRDGDLVARAGVDTETTVSVIAPIPFAVSTVLMLVVSTIWLFVIDVPLGLVAIIVFPSLVWTNIVYERSVSSYYTRAQDQLGTFSAAVHESFEGVQLVKAYGAAERETSRLGVLAGEVRDTRISAIRLRASFEAVLDAFPTLTNIGLIVLGAARVRSGDVTVGEFSGAIFLFTLLVFPLRLIGYALSELPRSMAAWNRIQTIVAEAVGDDPHLALQRNGPPPGKLAVRMSAVSFVHPEAEDPAVVDLDVSVKSGSVTAIVGPTGAGKTTMLELIAALVEPTSGALSVAGGRSSLVFQEAFLLAGTVRENVAFGGRVDDERIWEALELAEAADFVSSLPRGLDTIVGERGVSLSGGQRQRVALARALVRRPDLLVLDDTTSALDPATESRILANLRRAFRETTVVMVASRPSTIALADEVVFVSDGSVVAHGRHVDLMSTEAGYRDLVEAFESDRADR